MLRQQEYILAIQSLNLLKEAFSSVPLLTGEVASRNAPQEGKYPKAVIKEQLQLLADDIVTTYHNEGAEEIEGLVNKGELVQSLACLILFKLFHQKAN